MKKHRILSIMLSAVLLLSMVTVTTGAAAQTAPVTVSWIYWDNFETTVDLTSQQLGATLNRFNESQQDVKVEYIPVSGSTDYYTKLNALAAADQLPDIVSTSGGGKMKTYVDAGKYIDLTPYIDADPAWKDSFTDGIFSLCEFNGGIYGVPLNFAASCVFYNTELFAQVGAKVPTTWTEFKEACQLLKDAGIIPVALSGRDSWCIAVLSAYISNRLGGNEPFDAIVAGGGDWNNECFVKSGEMLRELYDLGYFQETCLGDGYDNAMSYVKSGEAAMLVMGSWAIGSLEAEDSEVKGKMGVFTFPAIEGGVGDPNMWLAKTDNVAISYSAKDPDACIKFIKALTDETSQKATAEIAGKIPVTNVSIDISIAPPEFGFLSDCMKSATGVFNFYDESLGSRIGDEYNNTMAAILAGTTTSADAFAALQEYTLNNR